MRHARYCATFVAFSCYLVIAAVCVAVLSLRCAGAYGWSAGQCVRLYDGGLRTFLEGRVLTTRDDGAVIIKLNDSTWGDHGIWIFDKYNASGKTLRPCQATDAFSAVNRSPEIAAPQEREP